MKQRKFPRGYKVYIPLVLMLVFFVFMLPRSPRFSYEYKKGEYWMYETLVAEFDFPILKTAEELKHEKDSVKHVRIPYFNLDEKVVNKSLARLDGVPFEGYEDYYQHLKDAVLPFIYSKGVFDPSDSNHYATGDDDAVCALVFDDSDELKVPVSEVFTVNAASEYLKKQLKSVDAVIGDSLYYTLNLRSLVIPNLDYNHGLTDDRYVEKVSHPSTTQNYMERSETIVEKGELITDQVANLLDSYKAEFDKSVGYSGTDFQMWSGLFIVSLLMVVMFFFVLFFCDYRIFGQFNKYLYVLLLYASFSSITFLLAREETEMYYMIPYSLMAMFMMAFFRRGFVMTMYFITLLPILVVTTGTVTVFFMHLVAGFMGIYVYQKLNRGWLQFVGSFIIYLIMLTVWIGFCLMFDNDIDFSLILYIALSAGLSIAGYPLIYLFERMFTLVSAGRLVELSDTSNTLLRQLADKAPGTFHHSLQVMNLSDAAARAINANVPLVRAAALYHDIGKINNPQCFTENEVPGVKVHDGLSPRESAQLIIKHVSDGIQLAEKHRLPNVLKEFIVTHHGTTCASYFLTKYLNDGGDPNDVSDFYYDGVRPKTKEQVILMFSDAVEAASRSLKDYSNESISKLVDNIINGKINDGQLAEAEISLRELTIIREVMKTFIQQVYHSRIEYPKRKVAPKN
jgi:putative nucleotidyltransferase with HDIG domain